MTRPALRLITGRSGSHAGAGGKQTLADRALADGVARGDRDAIAALTKRCLPMVYGLALRLLRDPGEAEDVAQEVFVKVWRKISSYDPERAKLETWIGRITINTCYDRLRKRRRSPWRTMMRRTCRTRRLMQNRPWGPTRPPAGCAQRWQLCPSVSASHWNYATFRI